MNLPIEEYFKYHPPTTEERKEKHNEVNEAALKFAKVIKLSVKDKDCRDKAIQCLLEAKMYANQGITVDELTKEKDIKLETFIENFTAHPTISRWLLVSSQIPFISLEDWQIMSEDWKESYFLNALARLEKQINKKKKRAE